MNNETHRQVVINPGTPKAQIWDGGDSPMSLEGWKEYLEKNGVYVSRVSPLRQEVGEE